MRIFLIVLVVSIIGVVGYAYYTNPAGCMKVVDDIRVLFVSVAPVKVEVKDRSVIISPNTNTPPAETNAAPVPSQ